jgi:Mn2+/Fe2+ NRAMP family transporter
VKAWLQVEKGERTCTWTQGALPLPSGVPSLAAAIIACAISPLAWYNLLEGTIKKTKHMLQTYLWPCASDEHNFPNRVLRFHANVMGDKHSRATVPSHDLLSLVVPFCCFCCSWICLSSGHHSKIMLPTNHGKSMRICILYIYTQ